MATNPVPIIIPCHRVIGSNGNLHGFAGTIGIPLKARLLQMEGATNIPPLFASAIEGGRASEANAGGSYRLARHTRAGGYPERGDVRCKSQLPFYD